MKQVVTKNRVFYVNEKNILTIESFISKEKQEEFIKICYGTEKDVLIGPFENQQKTNEAIKNLCS